MKVYATYILAINFAYQPVHSKGNDDATTLTSTPDFVVETPAAVDATNKDKGKTMHLRGLAGALPEKPGEGCGNGATFCPQGFYCDTTTQTSVAGGVSGSYPKCLKCGDDTLPCCDGNTCTQGLACGAGGPGLCGPCGVERATCCADNYCEEDLVCSPDGTCLPCGANNQRCCEGQTCNSEGLVCIKGSGTSEPTCQQCGGEAEPCCEDETCNDGYGCANWVSDGTTITRSSSADYPVCIRLGDIVYPCNPDGSCDLAGFTCNYDLGNDLPAACVECGGNTQPCCDGYTCNNVGQICDLYSRTAGAAPTCKDCGNAGALCCLTMDPANYCGAGLTCDWSGVPLGQAPFCNYAVCGSLGEACCINDICDDGECIEGICTQNRICSSPGLAIPDPGLISDTINVPVSFPFPITDLNIQLDLGHTYIGDLIITINSPEFTSVTLLNRPGLPDFGPNFGCSGNLVGGALNYVLDDDGTLDFGVTQCPLNFPPGLYDTNPSDQLSSFDGEVSQGSWTITVSDNAGADIGILNEWCLIFNTPPGSNNFPLLFTSLQIAEPTEPGTEAERADELAAKLAANEN